MPLSNFDDSILPIVSKSTDPFFRCSFVGLCGADSINLEPLVVWNKSRKAGARLQVGAREICELVTRARRAGFVGLIPVCDKEEMFGQ
jgi:hypothetical protein